MTAAGWIDDLERKAKAATPGQWEHDGYAGIDSEESPSWIAHLTTYDPGEGSGNPRWRADAEFIAAANPTTILRLIEDNRRMRHGSLCPECNAKAWGERADFRRERDELAARLAAVEALADETEQAGDPLLRLDRLRAALSTALTDTKENDR